MKSLLSLFLLCFLSSALSSSLSEFPLADITDNTAVDSKCQADINGDGVINTADMTRLLSYYEMKVNMDNYKADLSGNGLVDFYDLMLFLPQNGTRCPE